MKVGILLIATNKYNSFVLPVIESIERYFLPNIEKKFYLFTDKPEYYAGRKTNIYTTLIPSYKFPYATLYRYKIFSENANFIFDCEYLFYLDVDMKVVSEVNEEILKPLIAVQHPGYITGWGSPNNNPKSKSHLALHERKQYVAGGFQGGRYAEYLSICKILAENIAKDEKAGIMAEWHDETHWNWYVNKAIFDFTILNPSYCYPEGAHWKQKLSMFTPKILALEKNHNEIRK